MIVCLLLLVHQIVEFVDAALGYRFCRDVPPPELVWQAHETLKRSLSRAVSEDREEVAAALAEIGDAESVGLGASVRRVGANVPAGGVAGDGRVGAAADICL
ncbi:ORF1B [Fowl aviadenovirus 5]|uniref:ORF1B n=1 Tax=Fowl aviadenovirus 5 TaxID=172861 RepID=R4MTZ3_9ADEN|nr:ORF1B [Fowl aviadenovirus 5]AGL34672.1 ORF1B [Fowl aviadenovirus 5]